MRLAVIISFLLLILTSCTKQQTVTQEQLLAKQIAQKQVDYILKKNRECIDNALMEAEIYVDSIIYDMTQFSVLGDSLDMIVKPDKPERPDYLKINDSGPIVPFEIIEQ